MNKRVLGFIALLVVVIVGGGGLAYQNLKPQPKCLASTPATGPSGKELTNLELAAMEANMKAPAGSNADVRIAIYNGTRATGSVKFAPGYGVYNFSVEKISGAPSNSNEITWKLVDSNACIE